MKLGRLLVCVALALGALSACGEDEPSVMPDVTERRLDIALSEIERAGFEDEVEVVGGGTFGVIDESNWTVCDQEPEPGETIGSIPRLIVDRTCDAEDAVDPESSEESSEDNDAPEVAEPPTQPADKPRKRKKKARAPSTFVMPAVVGMVLQDAQDVLQSLGSYILTQTDATGAERFQVLDSGWKVCYQDPAPGVRVRLSYMVDLGVVKLHESCP